MKNFNQLLQKIDNLVPTPWIIDGREQMRPLSQIFLILGMIVGIIIFLIYFH
jgi:hypothetical protein